MQAHNDVRIYHKKEMKSFFFFEVFSASASCSLKFPFFTEFPPPPCLSVNSAARVHLHQQPHWHCLFDSVLQKGRQKCSLEWPGVSLSFFPYQLWLFLGNGSSPMGKCSAGPSGLMTPTGSPTWQLWLSWCISFLWSLSGKSEPQSANVWWKLSSVQSA